MDLKTFLFRAVKKKSFFTCPFDVLGGPSLQWLVTNMLIFVSVLPICPLTLLLLFFKPSLSFSVLWERWSSPFSHWRAERGPLTVTLARQASMARTEGASAAIEPVPQTPSALPFPPPAPIRFLPGPWPTYPHFSSHSGARVFLI